MMFSEEVRRFVRGTILRVYRIQSSQVARHLLFLALVLSAGAQVIYPRERYAVRYSYRTARADDTQFDTNPRYSRQPTYYNSYVAVHKPIQSSSVLTQAPVSKFSSRSYLESSSNSAVIKHPGTCSYDRSQAACTFSLICYLASGVPIEGCDDNPSVTCCFLNTKATSTQLGSNGDLVSPSTTTFRHYTSSSLPSTDNLITSTVSSLPASMQASTNYQSPSSSSPSSSSSQAVASALSSPQSPSISSSPSLLSPQSAPSPSLNSISNYYYPSSKYRPVSYNMPIVSSDGLNSGKLSTEPNYVDSYKLKKDSISQYDSKPYVAANNQEMDYYSNAIRRSRTENMKSIFQEIDNRKLYARNYNVEDSKNICGKPIAKPRSRIIGGQDAYFGEFPWQVHIKITKHQCGGALINSQFIVTAAHCIYQAPIRQLNVIIGAHDIEDPRYQDIPPQYFGVAKVLLHPNFRFSASHPDRYDIALIKLDKEVRFSDSVLPVCLPDDNVHFEGWKGVVTGWGKTDPALSNRYGTRLLQKVDVPIINNDKCELWHQTRGIDLRIFNEMMCAGYEDGQKDACVGDSGGPLVINVNGRWTLAGITSAGFGCAQSKQPGIYHRVSNTVEWIKSTILYESDSQST